MSSRVGLFFRHMKHTIVTCARSKDAAILAVTVPRLREVFPKASIHIYGSVGDPLPEELVTTLTDDAAVRHWSRYWTGAIRGTEGIRGRLANIQHALEYDANVNGIFMYVDSHTLVVNPAPITRAVEDDFTCHMFGAHNKMFADCIYWVKAPFARRTCEMARDAEFQPEAQPGQVISLLMLAASDGTAQLLENNYAGREGLIPTLSFFITGSTPYNSAVDFAAKSAYFLTNVGNTGMPDSEWVSTAADIVRARRVHEILEKADALRKAAETVSAARQQTSQSEEPQTRLETALQASVGEVREVAAYDIDQPAEDDRVEVREEDLVERPSASPEALKEAVPASEGHAMLKAAGDISEAVKYETATPEEIYEDLTEYVNKVPFDGAENLFWITLSSMAPPPDVDIEVADVAANLIHVIYRKYPYIAEILERRLKDELGIELERRTTEEVLSSLRRQQDTFNKARQRSK